MRLDEFLNEKHVAFEKLYHRPAYTADRVAQVLHVPGQEMAKTVLVRCGRDYLLAVLPATHRVDLAQLREELCDDNAELATEGEMEQLFPDCERGAMPPFGSIYHMPTLVDESLAADEQIVFEGQNHEEALRMKYCDYEALEHPRKAHFACRRTAK